MFGVKGNGHEPDHRDNYPDDVDKDQDGGETESFVDCFEEIERGCCEDALADGGGGGDAAFWAVGVWVGVGEVVVAPEAFLEDEVAAFWAVACEVEACEVVVAV